MTTTTATAATARKTMSKKVEKTDKCEKACECDQGVSQAEVQPWHRLGGVEHVCELRKSTSVLYAILVTIIRTIYANKKGRTFGCPNVVWKQDSQKTGIWIDTELRWEDNRPDFTPAIFVCLGDIQYTFPPFMDMQGRTFLSRDAEQHYERVGTCTASIVHVCDRAGEACSLADNTEHYLSDLQDQINQQYCFNHFLVVGRTALKKREQGQTAGKDKIMSVVTVKFDFTDAWMVKLETPILKEVTMLDDGASVIQFGDVSTETDIPADK